MADFSGAINAAKTIYFLGPTGVTPTILISVDGNTPLAGTGALDEYATGQFSYVLSAAERNGQESIALISFAGYQTQQFTVETITLPAVPGDAMTLTSGERTTSAMVFWNVLVDVAFTAESMGARFITNISASLANLPGNFWNMLQSTIFTPGSMGDKVKNWTPGRVSSYVTGQSPADALTAFPVAKPEDITNATASLATTTDVTGAQVAIVDAMPSDPPSIDTLATTLQLGQAVTDITEALPPDPPSLTGITTTTDLVALLNSIRILLTSANISVVSPLVSPSGTLTIYRGDSYTTQYGWGYLSWTGVGEVPDLSEAAVYFNCGSLRKSMVQSGSLLDGYNFSLELDSYETTLMNVTSYTISVEWESGVHKITIIRGSIQYL